MRISLAGGGTDVSPYCDKYGGCVLNTTIDRYAYAVIKIIDEPVVRFIASDLQEVKIKNLEEKFEINGELDLHKAVYNHMIREYNDRKPIPMTLSTFCDAPAGSGLGASSTLVVAMVKAFSELLNLPLDSHEIGKIALEVERVDCCLKGGKQDQYAATFGGFNYMEFQGDNKPVIDPLAVKNWIINDLESCLVLYFTGISRASENIIADQSRKIREGNQASLDAMHSIKKEAVNMKRSLLIGDFDALVDAMQNGWKQKKLSSSAITTEHIDKAYNAAIEAGALAGKVSGAGGGGFMLFYVPTHKKINVKTSLEQLGGEVSNCHFVKHGAQSWRIK
ncbi:MAG: dehydrogenase [Legionellales bacterium]|nr:dehydrogenase [Legionellales bacterium]